MKKKTYVLDTSVFLTDFRAIFAYKNHDIVIPLTVLEEIDNNKKRQDPAGANARAICRFLGSLLRKGNLNNGIRIRKGSGMLFARDLSKDSLPLSFDLSVPDNRIISVAQAEKELNPDRRVILVSCDINMRIKANSVGIEVEEYTSNQVVKDRSDLYTGYDEIIIDDQLIDRFYNGEDIILKETHTKLPRLYANQFLLLVSSSNPKKTAIARYINENSPLRKIKKQKKDRLFGFEAKNKEQQFALDLLLDPEVPVVSLIGRAGSGKTISALAAGLMQIMDKESMPLYSRLIVSRPVQPLGKDLGYLPGSIEEKMSPWLQPILDNLRFLFGNDKATLEEYIRRGIVELEALTYIRGRSIQNAFIIIDECFPASQCVATENEKIKIGTLYKMQEKGNLLPMLKTFNEKTQSFENKRIVSVSKKGIRELLEIKCSNRKIKCTPEHPFLTLEGWKPASELQPGDALRCYGNDFQLIPMLNEDQKQILFGSYLGDGSIQTFDEKNKKRLRITHGEKQRKYCAWKAKAFGANVEIIKENGHGKKPAFYFSTKAFYSNIDFDSKKQSVPKELLENINELGLAIWFMDDGNTYPNKNGARISVCSFSDEAVESLVDMLKHRFDIDCHSAKYSGYNYININKIGYLKLDKLISKYIHPDVFYKTANSGTKKEIKLNPNFIGSVALVKSIENTQESQEVFDIEMEDNHNFIICSSSRGKNKTNSGIVVHNCQNLTRHEMKTILTRVGFNTKIVLTGDIEQIDNHHVDEKSNGLVHMVEKSKDEELVGHIQLLKGERSKVATLYSNIL